MRAARAMWGAALGAVLVTAVAACSEDPTHGIRTAPVERGTVVEVVEAPASVTARASATVSSPADGKVADVNVRDGQRVAAGAVLLTIDSPAAQQRLADAQSALAQAESSRVTLPGADVSGLQAQLDASSTAAFAAARAAAQAIADPQRRKQALDELAGAEQRYQAAAAEARAAVQRLDAGIASVSTAVNAIGDAQRAQARLAVDVAQRAVDALVVKAPISGTVTIGGAGGTGGGNDTSASSLLGSLPEAAQSQASQLLGSTGGTARADTVAAGLPVSTGSTLVTVTDVSSLGLEAEVDETDVLQVRPGVTAQVQLDAVPDATYAARVETVDLAPGTSSRGGVNYRVQLSLGGGTMPDGSPAPRPRPGMSAVASLEVRRATDALSVPSAAVLRDGTRTTVWVSDGGRAERRTVTLGAQGDTVVQVTGGLREGERVVVHGADRVRQGQKLPS